MIISHTHKYVYVEFPQTGSSTVAKELMANYDGKRILFKHAQYHEFLKQASDEEKKYFSFSAIRNPMDVIVSTYFKTLTDHDGFLNNKVKHGKWLRRLAMPLKRKLTGNDVINNNMSFEEYFMKYHKLPYSAWSIMDHKKLNKVMRFEHLADDFAAAIKDMKIELIRPLPVFNKTDRKEKHFTDYFDNSATKARAVKVFGPYMSEWGYEFPTSWGIEEMPNPGLYNLVNVGRKVYWKFLR
jgi:hypothetical protein